MRCKGIHILMATIVVAVFAQFASGNPIPVPIPASMPLEDMQVDIVDVGGTLHADFYGDFTFDYIPEDVLSMLFPVPVDATNIAVRQDSGDVSWFMSTEQYPTVLPETPFLPMVRWDGPFPESGAVFTVEYEHDLIERPDEFVFLYALGTGKYHPTYQKITTAMFDISLPPGFTVTSICLDDTPVDPSYYSIDGSQLDITLTSEYGPFTKDLIITLVPEPATLSLLAIGGLVMLRRCSAQVLRRRK